ncbi:hypothetical protein Gpo141_00013697 [Globisporangium polare]
MITAAHQPTEARRPGALVTRRDKNASTERLKVFRTNTLSESFSVDGPHRTFAQTIRNLWAPQEFKSEHFDIEVFQLLLNSLRRKRERRTYFFKKHLDFSWLRFFSGLVSLILVCSDVPRSGLAIRYFPAMYPALEPDLFQSFGPWFYSVQKLSRDTAQKSTSRVWSYKFDTTSIAQRAFAEFFQLPTFPDCIMYRSRCTSLTLSGTVVFDMLDSLVNAAASRLPARSSSHRLEPVRYALKTENLYLDRLHHYLLPQVFVSRIWRTNQLFYYSAESLHAGDKNRTRRMCYDFQLRPSFCHELWINYRRSCLKTDTACRDVGLLWVDTIRRMRTIQQAFPGMEVDLTFLESQEDLQLIMGGFSPAGVRKADVTTIIRARQCSGEVAGDENHISTPANCSTVYIDEYRYELGMVYSEAVQWYRVVACLRGIGQTYYYVRIAMLFIFCYSIYQDEDSDDAKDSRPKQQSSRWRRLRKTCELIMKTPMQSVIFGSPFPILCYALAHSIDSAISYELLSKKFTTQAGIFQLEFQDFLTVGFNQMRSVWLLAALFHVSIEIFTSRRKLGWSPISGVLGVPEFLMSGLSSITIVAQYRSTSFRNTSILKMFETIDSSTAQTIKSRQNMERRGSGNMQFGGIWIDFKFFVCVQGLLLALFLLRNLVARYCKSRATDNRSNEGMQTRTPVPYSAGILWPIGAMSVHWTCDYFCIKQQRTQDEVTSFRRLTQLINKSKKSIAPEPLHRSSQLSTNWRSVASDAMESFPSILMSASDFRSIQQQMENVHERGDDVEATIAFMNLVNMSDPLVYFCILIGGGGGRPLGYYQSLRNSERFFLLPLGIEASSSISLHTQGLQLVYRVRSSSLNLSDLIHCG